MTLSVPFNISLSGLLLGLLAGCSVIGSQSHDHDVATAHSSKQEAANEELYRPIPADTLYALLVAEMAGQRQQFDVSLYHYMKQARRTGDPDISERAARIAQYAGSQKMVDESIKIWLKSSPDEPGAHQAAARQSVDKHDFKKALFHFERLLQLTGESPFDYMAANAASLPDPEKQHLLMAIQDLDKKYPDNANLSQAQSILSQQLGEYDEALAFNDRALSLDSDFLSAKIQRARLLANMQRDDDAIDWLEDLKYDYPDHKGIGILHARLLLNQEKMHAAHEAFKALHSKFPQDAAILLSLSLLDIELDQDDDAEQHLLQLLAYQQHQSEAHFYLGTLAQKKQQNQKAIDHFSQVTPGREFLNAHLNAAQLIHQSVNLLAARDYLHQTRTDYPGQSTPLTRIEAELLIKAKRPGEAISLLTQTLLDFPDNAELRYTRAMLAEQQDNMKIMEFDLRYILQRQPDHVEALNALGYSLANRTHRWKEALPLVKKALSLQPDNPAIIDSLGWVYFRSGDYDRALPLLKKAFDLTHDHEIAAHYGELLWIQNQQQQALDIWQKGLEHTPGSDVIQRTQERLKATPAAKKQVSHD